MVGPALAVPVAQPRLTLGIGVPVGLLTAVAGWGRRHGRTARWRAVSARCGRRARELPGRLTGEVLVDHERARDHVPDALVALAREGGDEARQERDDVREVVDDPQDRAQRRAPDTGRLTLGVHDLDAHHRLTRRLAGDALHDPEDADAGERVDQDPDRAVAAVGEAAALAVDLDATADAAARADALREREPADRADRREDEPVDDERGHTPPDYLRRFLHSAPAPILVVVAPQSSAS